MKQSPHVSVIIPVWNPGPGISRCVESLRGQTLEDIEMLFVDDCGTDGAMDVVRAAAAEDPRIRIITNEGNMGAGASRNAGIEAAQGEYLSFVDADDYIETDFLEILYCKGKSDDMDIVKGICINEFEEETTISKSYNLNNAIRKGLKGGKPLFLFFGYEHQSALYHRKLFVNPNVRYGQTTNGEDTTFLLKVCHVAKSFGMDDRACYHYIYRKSSVSNTMTETRIQSTVAAMRDRMEYLARFVEPDVFAARYFERDLKTGLALYQYVRKKAGMAEMSSAFLAELQSLALCYPNVQTFKDNDLALVALVDYGEGLAEWPFCHPCETPSHDDYVEVFVHRLNALFAHPELLSYFPKVVAKAKWVAEKMEADKVPSEKIGAYKRQIKAAWRRPSVVWMRFKFCLSVANAKRKSNNTMKYKAMCGCKI